MLNIILAIIYFTGCSFWFFSIFSNKVGRGGMGGDFGGGDNGFIGKGGVLSLIILIGWIFIFPVLFSILSPNFVDNLSLNLILGLVIGLPLGYILLKPYEKYTQRIYSQVKVNTEKNSLKNNLLIIFIVILFLAVLFRNYIATLLLPFFESLL